MFESGSRSEKDAQTKAWNDNKKTVHNAMNMINLAHPVITCGAQWVQILSGDDWCTLSLVYLAYKDLHQHCVEIKEQAILYKGDISM